MEFIIITILLEVTWPKTSYCVIYIFFYYFSLVPLPFIILSSLNTFISIMTGYSFIYDWSIRIDTNDSLINLFNFFWTSFTYLPSFFFLNLIIILVLLNNLFRLYIVVLFVIYNVELLDLLTLNYNFENLNLNLNNINLLLVNNLNKYHPFIFYISVYTILSYSFNILNLNYNFYLNFKLNSVVKSSYYYNQLIIFFNLLALFLGSWWALQEGTWGGWWNWDPSEVFGSLFGLTILLVIHNVYNYFNVLKKFKKIIIYVGVIIFFYFFIQLNFDIVSHNFGTNFFFFFNNNFFFLESSIMFFLFINYYVLKNCLLVNSISTYNYLLNNKGDKSLYPFFKIIFVNVLILVLIIYSFVPLFNYFVWNYLDINSLNLENIFKTPLIIFLIILFTLFKTHFKLNLSISLVIIFLSLPNMMYLFPLFLLYRHSNLNIIHSLLTYFLVINILSNDLLFTHWITSLNDKEILTTKNLLSHSNNIYICNNFFIEYDTYNHQYLDNGKLSINTDYLTNSSNLQMFLLIYDSYSFFNIYTLSVNWYNSYIYIENNLLNNLYEVFIYMYFCLLNYLFRNKKGLVSF